MSVCHVSQASGFRHDLAALADLTHSRGALLLVDAAQSAGAVALDVHRDGVDFLACTAMKWLLGAPGVGFLYVARDLAESSAPPQVGWSGVVDERDGELVFQPDARRHDVGMPSLPSLAASREGIGILLEVGLPAVERHVVGLAAEVIEGLRRRDIALHTPAAPGSHAGVVALPVTGGAEIVEFLRERRVDVWTDRSAPCSGSTRTSTTTGRTSTACSRASTRFGVGTRPSIAVEPGPQSVISTAPAVAVL